jgi:hypothetical protein
VSDNILSTLYAHVNSGATQLTYNRGFGMPTFVVIGGFHHQVLFSTQQVKM